MADLAAALASRDLALADPPGDDPTWPRCENCGQDLDDDKPGTFYCSLDCAYEAGKKGERAMWRERFERLDGLLDRVYGLGVEGMDAVYAEQVRIAGCIDRAVRESDEATVASFVATRRALGECAYPSLVGCIRPAVRQLYFALREYQEASKR
jgi:hypothetical protein